MPPGDGRLIRCQNCGALQQGSASAACQYCGAAFALPEPNAPPAHVEPAPEPARVPAPEPVTLQQRLRRLDALPDRDARFGGPSERVSARQSELTRSDRVQMGCGIGLLVVAGWLLLPCCAATRDPRLFAFAVLPLGIATLGFFLVRGARRRVRAVRADLVPCTAAIADKRTHVESRGERAHTTYFATLEFPDGTRDEHETTGDLYGMLRPGDVGVAWRNTQGRTRLLDFRVIDAG